MKKNRLLTVIGVCTLCLAFIACDNGSSSSSDDYDLTKENIVGTWTTTLMSNDFILDFTDTENVDASGSSMFLLSGKSGTWDLVDDVITMTFEGTDYDMTVVDFSKSEMEVSSVDLYGYDTPFTFTRD